jgi:hypothetical protein
VDPGAFNSENRADPGEPGPDQCFRASDADRDHTASVLGEALALGRLTAAEHAGRIGMVYAARTHAELVPLIEDLPAPGDEPATEPAGKRPARIVTVFGGTTRRGTWRIPARTTVVTVLGAADIDLRDAILPGQQIEIRAVSVLGGITVTIPPEMRVDDAGAAVFGGRGIPSDTPESQRPDAPVLRLRGAAVFGTVSVTRKG